MNISDKAVEASTCTCEEAFGQLIHSNECPVHARCALTMRGIPIRCILASGHRGDHK